MFDKSTFIAVIAIFFGVIFIVALCLILTIIWLIYF